MSGAHSRNKGARGERLWRDVLRQAGWESAERGAQREGGPDSPDVRGGPPGVHFECKLSKRQCRPWDWMAQCIADAGPDGEMPIVAWKRDRFDWLCFVRAEDLVRLLQEWEP